MGKLANQRILIVNDDGVRAPGIGLLERLVRAECDDVWVIAPSEEKSGASNSVSMHIPIRVTQIGEQHYAIGGTPTDAVIMALSQLMPERPTLVLSGINRGANLAEDVLYSGTIAATMEASLLKIPAIGLSQVFARGTTVPWETAERYTIPIIERLLDKGIPPGSFYNINFPPVAPDAVSGVRVTRQGQRNGPLFRAEGRVDCRDVPYFWAKLDPAGGGDLPGTDLEAIRDNAVSVCPLKIDLTDHEARERLTGAFDGI